MSQLDTLTVVKLAFVLEIFLIAFVMNSATTLMTAAVISLTFALSVIVLDIYE